MKMYLNLKNKQIMRLQKEKGLKKKEKKENQRNKKQKGKINLKKLI